MNYDGFTLNPALTPQEIALRELVNHLLIVLNDKEQYIIKNRFALGQMKERKTLEEIGQHFNITRERVRQIEKTALRKLERNAQNVNITVLIEFAKVLLEKQGGVFRDTEFKEQLLAILPNINAEEIQELHLALCLGQDLVFESNTLQLHPYWRMKSVDTGVLNKVISSSLKILNKTKKIIPLEELRTQLNASLDLSLSVSLLRNTLSVSKAFKFTEDGVGLYSWRHIHPRTLRDKILFILRREKKPLHFLKISEWIRRSEFDKKSINTQAVHNELIRNEQFILIGRGIYALREWGYKMGTVADVIADVLSDGKARSREEITKAVLEQRQVKTITIYLNLKNKAQFARVGRDKYTLA